MPLTPSPGELRAAGSAPDIEVLRAPRGFSATLGRTALFVVVAVVAVAGAKQVLWNPLFGRSGPSAAAPADAAFDSAEASQAAARYALDYLSYSPASSAAGVAALAADVSGGVSGQRWKGSGYLRAEAALPGTVLVVDASHALVAVTVRVRVAIPPRTAGTAQPEPQQETGPAGAAADPGPVPAGWHVLGVRWLTLTVPVTQTTGPGGSVSVSGGGAVFSGEAPQLVSAPTDAQNDPNLARDSQATAATLLGDYGSGDVAYVTAPGVTVRGLAGAVSLVSLPDWVTATPKQPAGSTATAMSATGTGTATWQLTGTDLQIAQRYALALTFSQDRWYIAAIGPQLTTTAP
ncbi:hypothetical protein [Nakamurella endophytica]|uniref:hypothetical protein n=1 Tax=Nakamurella endophytica TaxID=1748367 RepID=UPI00166D6695|nr:hypothetical protein [Nakamurella endophytica]